MARADHSAKWLRALFRQIWFCNACARLDRRSCLPDKSSIVSARNSHSASWRAAEREVGMYGDFVLFDEAGKLEKGERVYLGDEQGTEQ